MFMDCRDAPAPPPWRPPERPRRLTGRQRRVMAVIVALNLFLLLVAPIGGATIVAAIVVLWR